MATTSHPNSHLSVHFPSTKLKLWVVPLGRVFFSLIFIMSGINHFNAGTIEYAAAQGVLMPNLLVPLSGLMAIIGGLSVIFGYFARFGALLLFLFLVPVTLAMHNFWSITDPMMHQMQMIQFMKNLALIGATMLIFFYGAGPKSMDLKRPGRTIG